MIVYIKCEEGDMACKSAKLSYFDSLNSAK